MKSYKEVKKKLRIGCFVVILYCIGCSAYIGISGNGFFWNIAVFSTIRGGHISNGESIILRSIDIVTAPAQVAIFTPLLIVNYIGNHTGERGRERARLEQEQAAYERYMKLLDEDFDRIYAETEFLDPTNVPAMKALNIWPRWHSGEFNIERQRRFCEYCLEHAELMMPLRELWRMCKFPADLQRRALTVSLALAEKDSSEDVKWLLWGLMNVSAKDVSPGQGIPYTFSDEELQGYVTNKIEIIRWSAQEALKNRASYRSYLRRHENR
ncbi:MAG: hypothetical protein IJU44_12530 [Kiritimatiellae bacterium]|nr:hypothetical protein [Kiritimatiellia bacterium]